MGSPKPGRLARGILATSASLALILGVGTAAVGVQWYRLQQVGTDETWVPPTPSGSDEGPRTGECAENPCNYLILGSDSRAGLTEEEQVQFGTNEDIGGEQRADTVMLIHTDPQLQKAIILSLPRDLWVTIPQHKGAEGEVIPAREDKINAAFEG